MNKIFFLLVIGMMIVSGSIVFAEQGVNAKFLQYEEMAGSDEDPNVLVESTGDSAPETESEAQQQERRAQQLEDVQSSGDKNRMQVKTESDEVKLKDGNVEATSEVALSQESSEEGAKIKANLSNGRNAEVKIMPSTASATAIERLGLKNCVAEEGCVIELKETGNGNETKLVYEVEARAEGKFLGLFKTRAKVKTQVDAETGEIIKVKKPFLTTVKENKKDCADACPQLVSPGPNFCPDGKIVSGGKDSCGCEKAPKCVEAENETETEIANPASEFCEDNGGVLEIRAAVDGQRGVCIIGGIECDEWDLMRGNCDGIHVCTKEEKESDVCTMEYMPVCGSDGKTYGNICQGCSAKAEFVLLGTICEEAKAE